MAGRACPSLTGVGHVQACMATTQVDDGMGCGIAAGVEADPRVRPPYRGRWPRIVSGSSRRTGTGPCPYARLVFSAGDSFNRGRVMHVGRDGHARPLRASSCLARMPEPEVAGGRATGEACLSPTVRTRLLFSAGCSFRCGRPRPLPFLSSCCTVLLLTSPFAACSIVHSVRVLFCRSSGKEE